MTEHGRIRIGELSRRVGASPELLRAWESRYAVVRPARTPGGLRLYSEHDVRRIQAMQRHIARGLSASEAARMARTGSPGRDDPALGRDSLSEIEAALAASFDALDEDGAQAALDRLFASFGLQASLDGLILPFLAGLGTRWGAAEATVAQERFASNVIGGRLRALARGWGQGVGPRAVLACPPGEHHEFGPLAFGLALHERGWRITYLGADVPVGELVAALDQLDPAVVVLAAVDPERFRDAAADVLALTTRFRVALGGPGASALLAAELGAEWLGADAIAAASRLVP